jgi:D-alanyl-lipoteichoic acid acyltransferase DltB (MBOAT superfamily)
MLFNSPTFVVFFICVFCLYWLLRSRQPQNVLLLIASYVFYGAWSWNFLLLLILSTLVDYSCGRLIAVAPSRGRQRLIMIVSVSISLAVLATFKYLGFFVQEAAHLLESLGFEAHLSVLNIVLPVGISFYTFQTIGYVVDVYRGKVPAERNLLNYALYVAFFPQLVAGPIERAGHLLPQIRQDRHWNKSELESGLQLMVWGLFKKVVIADNLAPFVNAVYLSPQEYSGEALATATVFFAFQIYCDFSGYTDTARGAARMLGFELIRNFNFPYTSRTPVEFWQRWHMSLSQWFQDYLYFPLAMHYMRKGGWGSKYKAHIIAMGLIGLWHGANWTFVVFGLYWGILIALYLYLAERIGSSHMAPLRKALQSGSRLSGALAMACMFVLVCVGWIFFRADSITSAWQVLSRLFSSVGETTVRHAEVLSTSLLWAMVVGLLLAEWVYRSQPRLFAGLGNGHPAGIVGRYALFAVTLFSYLIAQQGVSHPFIYFQF